MYLDMERLKPTARYHVLTQSVIPRPIAWILTDNGVGEGESRYNLAPFSFFNVVSATPPLLVVGIGTTKTSGESKDTLTNLLERKKATIHLAAEKTLEAMVDSSVELPHGESEIMRDASKLNITFNKNGEPHIQESPIAFFCELEHVYEAEGGHTTIVFCKINETYLNEDILEQNNDGKVIVDPLKIKPITRLGLTHYHKLESIFSMERPVK
jgi:flavin reductase (DIM6/NTAB) family NADH-FMN oxidoreductase RutF